MKWEYIQPVKIYFGVGERKKLPEMMKQLGCKRAVLVCDKVLLEIGTAKELADMSEGMIVGIYDGTRPNPTVDNVDQCAALIRESKADCVIALGGGSSIDCAKAAAAVAPVNETIKKYHGTGVPLPGQGLPLIAIPTTAGTGSEVTAVSVLSNEETGVKAPLLSPLFYAKIAIVDPELTYSVPPGVVASTGLDALSHAVEGYYSINHQPVTDALCISAARTIFQWLERACDKTLDIEAKEKMAEASLIAGLGFNLPKTGPSHACSFVLTNKYHIPHGEACILTQDYFVRVIGANDGSRLNQFASALGFKDANELADRIYSLKKKLGVRCDLKDLKLTEKDVDELVKASRHPNIKNSPVEITDEMLYELYHSLI
jgi:alcohol dehydrogenase class IV